nr:histidine kinase dimerization/phospho-acceptor domain-containing protein [Paenibacillus sp. ICGEB2008]
MNQTTGVIIALQDITELETLRSELGNFERLSLVGQMAAGITHEIRNPMAVVRGFLQLMREKSLIL